MNVSDTPTNGQVLTFNSTISLWDAQTPTAGGEDNTSSNSGAGDGWALTKVGVDLPFKSLITSSPLATTSNASDLTITIDNIAFTLLADGVDGELITWDAVGAPAAVAVGTSGQVLTSNGAGAAPTFQAGGGVTTAIQDTSLTANFTMTSATITDVTGLSITIANQAGGACHAEFSGVVKGSSAALEMDFTIDDDGTDVFIGYTVNNSPNTQSSLAMHYDIATNGSVLKIQANSDGTNTLLIKGDADMKTHWSTIEIH